MGKIEQQKRELVAGDYCHIHNRGNRRENIAWDEEDKGFYLDTILRTFARFDERLISYTIMDNHYHLMNEIVNPANIAKVMQSFGIVTTRYFNKKYKTVGHLFQSGYKLIKVENLYYKIYLSKYIHRNPLKLAEVNNLEEFLNYQWSSLQLFINNRGKKEESLDYPLYSDEILQHFKSKDDYLKYILSENPFDDLNLISKGTDAKEIQNGLCDLILETSDKKIGSNFA